MLWKTRARFFILFLFLLVPSFHASAQECLEYEPATVTLTGTISRKTFPGPPNYESIRKGDRPETYWVLHLEAPICTKASADNDAESNVTDIQLILTVEQYGSARQLIRRYGGKGSMTFRGKLSHAITGHHHTPVLLEVWSMDKNKQATF